MGVVSYVFNPTQRESDKIQDPLCFRIISRSAGGEAFWARLRKSGLVRFEQPCSAKNRASCGYEKVRSRQARGNWRANATYAQKTSVAWSATTSKKRSEEVWRSGSGSFRTRGMVVEGVLGRGRWATS